MNEFIKAEIVNPNPKSTINLYSSFGYNLSSAIADIIDNSVSECADEIRIEFNSIGPLIEPDEREKIFEKRFRGRNAINSSSVGTGIGLNNASSLIKDHFNGTIEVVQSAVRFNMNEIPYVDISFVVTLPRNS